MEPPDPQLRIELRKARQREAMRRWRAANPEQNRLNVKRRYWANHEVLIEQARLWREANREATRTYQREWARQHPEIRAWRNIIYRCEDPQNPYFKDYGGRGIRICAEWRQDFAAFFAHIGPRPGPGYSVDRIDNDGHYEPGNVRWATSLEQNNNHRKRQRRSQ